ncbi:response regulator [Candidatus Kaiserbacteria bacterium]|nr:response regulator [Candidatus Kaiserbacteria bacterium]
MTTQKTVLIVEDETDIREALRDALHDKAYAVLEAKDGNEGAATALEKHPDLILLDLRMPEMDGMTAFKHIREDGWGKTVPVIILTNLNANSEHLVDDIVTHKPMEYLIKSDWKIYDVVEKVRNVLRTHETVQ